MITQEIEKIIIKYLTNDANGDELDILSLWLKDSNNEAIFISYVKTNYGINYNMKQYDADKTELYVLNIIHKDKKANQFKRYRTKVLKYVAIAMVFLTIGYIYNKDFINNSNKLIIPQEHITLQLENGEIKIIEQDAATNVVDSKGDLIGVQSGKQLQYKSKDKQEVLRYNTLSVPYGQRFEVQLSDGTQVTLNAGSSLKYPVRFIKGENRDVYLKGEAFFNVIKDNNHPFIVNTEAVNIRVLGTKFNVSSYPEDTNLNTVLVEGAVVTYKNGDLYPSRTATELKPGYKAAWDREKNAMKVEKTNIETHTAWIDGRLILQEVAFKDILKKLERQYNVTFINNNKALDGRYFTAKFDIEDIYQVLQSLSLSGNFTYKFNQDTIIINP